jgi:hypothetical protein
MNWIVLVLAAMCCSAFARAEAPLLSSAELQDLADHVVAGKVHNVYQSEKIIDKGYTNTLYAVEVSVAGSEKGEGIAAGQIIYAKAWRMKLRPEGWAGPSGQSVIPKPGHEVKLYLTGDAGNYDALSPNGIDIVKKK